MRQPLQLVAVVLLAIVVCAEVGSGLVRLPSAADRGELERSMRAEGLDDDEIDDAFDELDTLAEADSPPGRALPALGIVDGLWLLTLLGLLAASVLDHGVQGRIAAPVTLVVSLLLVVGGIVVLFQLVALLFLMLGLFLAAPFGTIAYLARWGGFPRGTAQALLGATLLGKLAVVGLMAASWPRVLREKGYMALVVTSVVLHLVIGFLHGFGPVVITSITDAVAAIVVTIVGIVWAVVVLVGSLVGALRILRGRRGGTALDPA